MQLFIENVKCGGCARTVTETIEGVDSRADVNVDTETRTVDVQSSKPSRLFLRVLKKAGYPASLV